MLSRTDRAALPSDRDRTTERTISARRCRALHTRWKLHRPWTGERSALKAAPLQPGATADSRPASAAETTWTAERSSSQAERSMLRDIQASAQGWEAASTTTARKARALTTLTSLSMAVTSQPEEAIRAQASAARCTPTRSLRSTAERSRLTEPEEADIPTAARASARATSDMPM